MPSISIELYLQISLRMCHAIVLLISSIDISFLSSMNLISQAARLLALLAEAEEPLLERRWLPFLRAALASDDCKLSSHAARALLNLASARAARQSSHHARNAATASAGVYLPPHLAHLGHACGGAH